MPETLASEIPRARESPWPVPPSSELTRITSTLSCWIVSSIVMSGSSIEGRAVVSSASCIAAIRSSSTLRSSPSLPLTVLTLPTVTTPPAPSARPAQFS